MLGTAGKYLVLETFQETETQKVFRGIDAVDFLSNKIPHKTKSFAHQLLSAIVFLHTKGLFYGKLILKHLILVVKNKHLISSNSKSLFDDDESVNSLNMEISDEEADRDDEDDGIEVEVYLDGLNLEATTDLNYMFKEAWGEMSLLKHIAPELLKMQKKFDSEEPQHIQSASVASM